MSVEEHRVSLATVPQVMDRLQMLLQEDPIIVVSLQTENTGKWGMARLWRLWMSTTAQHMAARGCTMPLLIGKDGEHYGTRPFNETDAHELFTHQWLGVDKDGTRLSWSRTGRDGMRPATKGERFNALRQHENWAIEKGITLFQPRGSEYEQLKREEEQ